MRAFRCSRTGMLYPSDYIEEWGRKYGIGLGPTPVSEALVNLYGESVAESEDMDKTMHPVGVCLAQIDCVDVTDAEWERDRAILQIDDPKLSARAPIMRDLQLCKSRKMQTMFSDQVADAINRVDARKRFQLS